MPALPDSAPEKWQYTEHARVKHELLAKYLKPWAMITGSGVGRKFLAYVDGFAGRGQYVDDNGLVTTGSPVIALQQSPLWLNYVSNVALHFVERDQDNYENLRQVIRSVGKPDQRIQVGLWNKSFADAVSGILEHIPCDAPAFFMIDPFGFGGVPFSLITDILSRPRAEVFFTLMVRDMAHYLTAPNAADSLTELFGTDAWKNIADSGRERDLALRELYVNQIRREAKTEYIWTFRVCMDDAVRTLYYLVHVTNHWKGVATMKSVMYNQGGQGIPGTFAFLGPQDRAAKNQLTFFNDPEDVEPLQALLRRQFAGRRATFNQCMEETIHLGDNPCIEKHYRKALKDLEEKQIVRVTRVTSKTVRGLAEKDIIRFP